MNKAGNSKTAAARYPQKSKASSGLKPEDIIKGIPAPDSLPGKFSLLPLLQTLALKSVIILRSDSQVRLSRFSESFFTKIKALQPSIEKEVFHAPLLDSEKNISPLLFSLKAPGLFSTAKINIIKNAEVLKANILNKLTDNVPPSGEQMLILLCKGEKLPALEAWKKLIEKSSVCEFSPFSTEELKRWIIQEARKRGTLGLSSQALAWLSSQRVITLDQIDALLEKAALLTDLNQEIKLETLQSLFKVELDADSFNLFQSIAKKDHLNASLTLHAMLENGAAPLFIMGFFNKAIKGLIADSKLASSYGASEHSPDLKNSWFLNKLSRGQFQHSRLKEALHTLAVLDSDLKGKNIGEYPTIKSKLIKI